MFFLMAANHTFWVNEKIKKPPSEEWQKYANTPNLVKIKEHFTYTKTTKFCKQSHNVSTYMRESINAKSKTWSHTDWSV